MTEQQIVPLLVSHLNTSTNVQLAKLSDNTFKFTDLASMQMHAVKVSAANKGRGIRGILQAYNRTEQTKDLMQPVTDIIYDNDYVIALLDWFDGNSLREANRNLLPQFFGRLREWHLKNLNFGLIYSPFTTAEYESIDDFIEGETIFHLRKAKLIDYAIPSINLISGLRHGFITLLHGDIHPGNIHFDGNRFVLLDPEYVHCGINLLDLDYIQFDSSLSREISWWQISKYAQACLTAYFTNDEGFAHNMAGIMASLKALNLLRSISNSLNYGTGTTMELVEQFKNILLEAT